MSDADEIDAEEVIDEGDEADEPARDEGEADEDEPAYQPTESMSYAEFGAAFVHEAVTPKRVAAVVGNIAGEAVQVGPIQAGPGGVGLATAVGEIGEAEVTKTGHEPLGYELLLPVDLTLDVTVAGTKHHYDVDAKVRIRFRVVLEPPLSICIEPESPTYRDVDVRVRPKGVRARVVGQAGNIDRELRKHIARYLRERIATEVAAFAEVDLLPLMHSIADQLTS